MALCWSERDRNQGSLRYDSASLLPLLNDLIDRDDALEASPMLVKRLRRLREARMAARTAK